MRPLTRSALPICLCLLLARPGLAWPLARMRHDVQDGRSALYAGQIVLVLAREPQRAMVLGPRIDIGPLGMRACTPPSELEALPQKAVGMARLDDPEGHVNLRRSPGLDAPVLKALPVRGIGGNCVFVLSWGEWCEVMTGAGQRGFIHTSRLVPMVLGSEQPDADEADLVETAARLARQDPGVAGAVVCLGLHRYRVELATLKASLLSPFDAAPLPVTPAYLGRQGDWALLTCLALDREGRPRRTLGLNWLLVRESGRWSLKGRMVEADAPSDERLVSGPTAGAAPPVLPADFMRVFCLVYPKSL